MLASASRTCTGAADDTQSTSRRHTRGSLARHFTFVVLHVRHHTPTQAYAFLRCGGLNVVTRNSFLSYNKSRAPSGHVAYFLMYLHHSVSPISVWKHPVHNLDRRDDYGTRDRGDSQDGILPRLP